MWAIVFASLMVAIGLYQVYSTRKVAEDIAKAEMFDMDIIFVEKRLELENEIRNSTRIQALVDLIKKQDEKN